MAPKKSTKRAPAPAVKKEQVQALEERVASLENRLAELEGFIDRAKTYLGIS